MGQIMGTYTARHLDLQMDSNPTFPTHAGFTYKRQRRGTNVSAEALSSAKIPLKYRDFCGGPLLDYQVCRYKEMPLLYRCHHERHAYLSCEQEDYVIRMKEFERERRLRERELRIKKPPKEPATTSSKEPVKGKEEKPKEC